MNDKGKTKLLSGYWYIIIIIIAAGIISMVYLFYNSPYDARDAESRILSEKAADCISFHGIINENIFFNDSLNESFSDNFLSECSLNFETDSENPEYFIEIIFYNISEEELFSFSKGNINWRNSCFIKNEDDKQYKNMVYCNEMRFYAVDNDENQYLIKIISGVGKTDKNVR